MGNRLSANNHWIEQTRDSSRASTSTPGTLSTSGTFSTQNLTCEVFLSFRGPDTRLGFTSHLHRDLKTHGIEVFIDKENLEEGFEIHPYLRKAIEKSQYAVVIISERFADSKSCLMELSEIMERKRKGWIKVFPIFYHVEPSDVRHQKGMFGKQFAQFREELGSKVDSAEWEKWTAALKEVGELKGWSVQNREEAQIVQEISLKLFRKLITKSIGPLFGIETQIESIMDLLRLKSGGVRFIVICGIGGIGKSTLARVIVERASPKFCATSIVDVGKHGIYKLGKQLIHDLISPDAAKSLKSEENVRDTLGRMLKNKKVLVVLDDLYEEKKLEVAKAEWFGDGSRIIITSRYRKWPCLDKGNIYDVRTLTDRAATELFCSKASPEGDLGKEHWELVKEFVNLAKGLPLALEVYGSHVKGEEKGYWEGYRDDLKKNVDENVKGHLQITFERLEPRLRDAFLDIVCFFNYRSSGFLDWKDKDRVQEALVGLGHSSNILRDLENKSLLKFFKHNLTGFAHKSFMHTFRPIVNESLSIHDLLVQIGEEIADQERLWRVEDIVSELQENSGNIEIAKLKVLQLRAFSINEGEPIKICLGGLSKMKDLRMVDICDDLGSLEWCGEYSKLKLSNELRYLLWDKYPFESFPAGFIPTNLIELKLTNSSINQLWNGDKCGYIVPNVACGPTLKSRIPKWFIHTGTPSSNETIQIHMDWNSASDSPDAASDSPDAASDSPDAYHILNGCALLITYEVYGNGPENSDISACEGSNRIFPEFVCRLQCEEVSSQVTFTVRVPEEARVGSQGVWVFINFGKFELWGLEKWSYLISVTASSENVKLKECGARLLQKDSESEFCSVVSNISRPGLDSVSISGALRNYLQVTNRRPLRSPKLLGFSDWIRKRWDRDECGRPTVKRGRLYQMLKCDLLFLYLFSSLSLLFHSRLCNTTSDFYYHVLVLMGAPNGIDDTFTGKFFSRSVLSKA